MCISVSLKFNSSLASLSKYTEVIAALIIAVPIVVALYPSIKLFIVSKVYNVSFDGKEIKVGLRDIPEKRGE